MRERGSSRGGSRAGSQASRGSVSRTQSLGAGTRGDVRHQRSRPRLERSASAPGTPVVHYRPASVTSLSRGSSRASLEDPNKQRRRAKRSGYNHPAAMQSAPDLLYMPPNVEAEAKKANPFKSYSPAGVGSDRMTQLLRGTIDSNDKKKRPQPKTDPITHTEFDDDDPFRDAPQLEGAAGVRSGRLAIIESHWIEETGATGNDRFHPLPRTDPISHIGGPPPPLTKGIRRYEDGRSKSMVPIFHNTEMPARMAPEKVQGLMKTKVVKTGGGEVIYNVAGEGDMIPAATHRYTKADLPASAAYKARNNKQMLPNFYRQTGRNQNPALGASEDMIHSMYGENPRFVKTTDKPDYAALVAAMSGGRTPTLADMNRFTGFLSARGERRPARAASVGSACRGAQTYREPLSTQRRQSDPAGRTRNLKSADGYVRRSSVAGSNYDLGTSIDGKSEMLACRNCISNTGESMVKL